MLEKKISILGNANILTYIALGNTRYHPITKSHSEKLPSLPNRLMVWLGGVVRRNKGVNMPHRVRKGVCRLGGLVRP